MITRLSAFDYSFPHPSLATSEGIVAWGGDLSPTRLIRAYKSGIFPWYSKGDPILWWSLDPRAVLELDDFKLSKSLKKSMKKFEVKFDTNFKEVMLKCKNIKRADQNGTWIQDEVVEAYCTLYDLGIAHSVESYLNGELVGGVYGVVVGGVFCGESMFSQVSDASKTALASLVAHLKKQGFDFIDAQVPTPHIMSLGAKNISRDEFLKRLELSNQKVVEF